jgi:glycosyltransferase involved in cell wall biosynthesis
VKIGIDARTLSNRRGIGNVVFNLLHGLAKISCDCSYIIYVNDVKASKLIPDDPRFITKILKPKIYPIWEQISLPLSVIRDRLDILHCPGNSAPVSFFVRTKLVLTIHDVIFMFPVSDHPKSPSWYQRFGRTYLKYIVPVVAKRAAAIITVSAASRDDILQYISVPTDRISVVWSAANGACKEIIDNKILSKVRKQYDLSHSFILVFGALDPRKNTAAILKAYAKYRSQEVYQTQLMIVGLTENGKENFRNLAVELGITANVVFAGFVDEDDLVALYSAAELLLYPSLYEGFGLPVLEAMICGTPVITSRRGSIPEIAGDAAVFVDPLDVDGMADAIRTVLTDKVVYTNLVSQGIARAKLFSWQRAAEQTFKIYQMVIDGK